MLAAREAQADTVESLLCTPGIDVNETTGVGDNALTVACRMGHLAVVKLLVAAGARVEAQIKDTRIGPLATAALEGHLDVVKYLVEEAGADVTRAGMHGETPIRCAASEGHVDVVEYLMGRPGSDFDALSTHGGRALTLASENGHLAVVKLLVATGARVEAQAGEPDGPLAIAALGGHLDVIKYLVEEAGADGRGEGPLKVTPLMMASSQGHLDVLKYLLGRGVSDINAISANGESALTMACQIGHLECSSLFKVEAVPNLGRETLLEVVKLLVAAGSSVEAQAGEKLGPLITAILAGHLDVVKYLVEEGGADVTRASPDGRMPIMCAVMQGHAYIVEYLLGRPGVDFDAMATHGEERALTLACGMGHLAVVKLLVAAGSSVEAQAGEEVGPLMAAAWGGHLHVVKYLVEEAGADVTRADPDGRPAMSYAVSQGQVDIVEYLGHVLSRIASRREHEVRVSPSSLIQSFPLSDIACVGSGGG
jgi:ankyrin repeat protein